MTKTVTFSLSRFLALLSKIQSALGIGSENEMVGLKVTNNSVVITYKKK